MDMATIRTILESSKGRMMTVTFKKADGSIRVMNCRTGVKKYLKGGESTIADKPNLFGVYENGNNYRCFDLNRVISARIDGAEIKFKKENN